PDDGIENWLREYLGAPLIDKPRERYKAIQQTIREQEEPKPGEPGIEPEDVRAPKVGAGKPNGKGGFGFRGREHDAEFQGIPLHIENPRGSVRSGTDPAGRKWRVRMTAPYGFVKGTTGADGGEIGAFVGV